ncbi:MULTISPECIES: diacylglycerol/lipid kinase family protein [Ramlibacter]|uniref:Diacylglycerol kinase n=1 Tax=Ramlibacter pinisoli TaxID=2682844 RepID=A0A6N8IWD1_9BURK|nr:MULTISPECIES: diacylglycerol kinase family protein [Ramlibacter]MBA2961330.1 diacylglycerol kinase [Ramlibacter sp. CGMCC 1.13660]MVQ31274.1 diacylglycerol kinase [Ramlibacter pinisoli]
MQAAQADDISADTVAGQVPELLVVSNPGSGAQDGQARREALATVFREQGRAFRFIDVDGPGDLEEASRRAAEEARGRKGVIVAVGGDGTINTVAQAAWRAGCALGVLPQGTFNLFGRDHGIAQDLEQAARMLLRARPRPVAVGEVNGRLFLVNASVGLYPQLLEDREVFKQQFGRRRWVAVLAGLVTIFEWRRQLTLEFERDGQAVVVRTPTLFVGNNRLQLERIGLPAEVVARVGEGELAAVMARPIGTGRMVLLMLRGAIGRLGEAEQVDSFAFRSLTVKVVGMRKLKLAADGEVGVMAPPLRFSVASRPLLLMVPRDEDRVPVA